MKFLYYPLLLALFTACIYDDNLHSPEDGTDFSKDISNITDFYLSTPVELKLLDKDIETSDSIVYKVGDTLKLSIEINEIHQDTETDFYNLYKSTGSESYNYSLYLYSIFNTRYLKTIDLEILENNPEIINNNLTDTQIKTHPVYKELFINHENVFIKYKSELKKYTSKIGIILNEENIFKYSDLIYSEMAINTTSHEGINISIPLISALDNHTKYIHIVE